MLGQCRKCNKIQELNIENFPSQGVLRQCTTCRGLSIFHQTSELIADKTEPEESVALSTAQTVLYSSGGDRPPNEEQREKTLNEKAPKDPPSSDVDGLKESIPSVLSMSKFTSATFFSDLLTKFKPILAVSLTFIKSLKNLSLKSKLISLSILGVVFLLFISWALSSDSAEQIEVVQDNNAGTPEAKKDGKDVKQKNGTPSGFGKKELARTRYIEGHKLYKEKKYKQAIPLLTQSAMGGYAPAQSTLGVCHYLGQGVAQEYSEAANWYKKAAQQNYARAQYNLGFLFFNGHGVKKSKAQAKHWWLQAAKQDFQAAKEGLKLLEN
jgi:hypothetical protein